MKRLICICVAVMLLATIPAMAMTGNDLKELGDNRVDNALFLGYVFGTLDTNNSPIPNLCIPHNAINKQVVEVVRKYLKDHPEELHLLGSELVKKALPAAWPCKK